MKFTKRRILFAFLSLTATFMWWHLSEPSEAHAREVIERESMRLRQEALHEEKKVSRAEEVTAYRPVWEVGNQVAWKAHFQKKEENFERSLKFRDQEGCQLQTKTGAYPSWEYPWKCEKQEKDPINWVLIPASPEAVRAGSACFYNKKYAQEI